jgi:hypothetical protein
MNKLILYLAEAKSGILNYLLAFRLFITSLKTVKGVDNFKLKSITFRYLVVLFLIKIKKIITLAINKVDSHYQIIETQHFKPDGGLISNMKSNTTIENLILDRPYVVEEVEINKKMYFRFEIVNLNSTICLKKYLSQYQGSVGIILDNVLAINDIEKGEQSLINISYMEDGKKHNKVCSYYDVKDWSLNSF